MVRSLLFTKDRWNPGKVIPWEIVKEKWSKDWDYDKLVLLEKSPPHLVRAKQLEMHFPQSYFIIMIRNPYAFCESVKRRWGNKPSFFRRFSYFNIAKFWVICAHYQVFNIKHLQNAMYFSYEELTHHPRQICQRILDFVPELGALDPERKFIVSEKHMKIKDLNETQIRRLSDNDTFEINEILKEYPALLNFFNYQYEEPSRNIKFKTPKRVYMRVRSLNRLPNPVMWQNWKKLPRGNY